ncbi:MAG TPA: hypothetical protein VIM98_18140 [Dyella sp.]|uniref:hypothetical protein n=1 Tax=Dyella sp. TaxID=1869338 RepID=UPI002F92AC49
MCARQFLPFLFGCTLFATGAQLASAADVDNQDNGTLQHAATVDSASAKSSGGDALGTHDVPPATGSSASPSSDSGSRGGSSDSSAPSRRTNLGWQSLLPGSIQ